MRVVIRKLLLQILYLLSIKCLNYLYYLFISICTLYDIRTVSEVLQIYLYFIELLLSKKLYYTTLQIRNKILPS